MNFKYVEQGVHALLINYPETQSNDHLLYTYFMEKILDAQFTKENFIKYQQSFESISRTRRRLQEKYPELQDKITKAKREIMEQEYESFYGKFIGIR